MSSQDFDLLEMVESVAADLKVEARQRRISIMSAMLPELPRALHGEAELLKQTLVAMCRLALETTTGAHVYLEAAPCGANVSPSHRNEITFSVNYDSEQKPDDEQLDEVRTLAADLGVFLSAYIAAGRGARLSFSRQFDLGRRRIPPVMLEEKLKHASVFIVSNEPAPNRAFHVYLRFAGVHCNGAPTAAETIVELGSRAAASSPYDLLIIASPIDDMPPREIARTIRTSEELKHMKLLFIDDYELDETKQDGLFVGFDGYLAKPVTQDTYLRTVTKLLGAPSAIDEVRAEASRQRTVLVVEDNPVNQKTALFQLRRLGFQSDIASNGAEALEALDKNAYQLVFMDLQMPVMDGFECTQRIREQDRFKDLPIVALTANDSPENRRRCIDVGMSDFLSKPATLDSLRKILESWVGQKSGRE